jgi:hypothetical protein
MAKAHVIKGLKSTKVLAMTKVPAMVAIGKATVSKRLSTKGI